MKDDTRGKTTTDGNRTTTNNTSSPSITISQGLLTLQTHEQMNGDKKDALTAESITIDKQIADMITELGVTTVSNSVIKAECVQCKIVRKTAKMIEPLK